MGVGPDDLSQVGRHLSKGQALPAFLASTKAQYTGVEPVLLVSWTLADG